MEYKYDVFISYSRKDTEVADKICSALDSAGLTYFIDRQGIGGGMEFPAVLAKAIKESKVFLFLASKNSYDSKFTQSEIVYAFNKKQKQDIIPYIIDGSTLPEALEFTFSAINWRQMDRHPIETTLINDILYKTGKSTNQPDNSDSVTPKKEVNKYLQTVNHFLSGKNVARLVLIFSIFLSVCGFIFSKLWVTSFHSIFGYIGFLLFFPVIGCLLLGLIRPVSICLNKRTDVLKFYFTSAFFLLLSIGSI